jgi:DNA polymerase-3 subunit alpha
MAVVEKAIQSGASALADRRSGQKSLFGGLDADAKATAVSLPDIPDFPDRERATMEKEVLGFYLSSHPLAEYQSTLRTFCTHATAELAGLPDRTEVFVGGMLSAIKPAHVKNARPGAPTKYVNFDLEDLDGVVRCILWPDDFASFGHFVQPDAILLLRGVVDRRGGGDEVNLIVNELIPLDELGGRYTTGLVVRISESPTAEQELIRLREIVRGYPGSCELQLVLQLADGACVQLSSRRTRLDVNAELRARLDEALGAGNVRLITSKPSPAAGKRPRRAVPNSPPAPHLAGR